MTIFEAAEKMRCGENPKRLPWISTLGMPIVLGRRQMKRDRLARKKARAKARRVTA